MNSNLNLPTDNPYKLMAIFGVFLVLSGIFFLFIQHNKQLDNILKSTENIIHIDRNSQLSEKNKKESLKLEKRKINIAAKEIDALPIIFSLISIIGFIISFIGFWVWITKSHKLDEEIKQEQLKKLKITNRNLLKNKNLNFRLKRMRPDSFK